MLRASTRDLYHTITTVVQNNAIIIVQNSLQDRTMHITLILMQQEAVMAGNFFKI